MTIYNWIIRGGRVIDPLNSIDQVLDIAIAQGKIVEIAPAIDPAESDHLYQARGQIVVPGLIDLHIHGYDRVTPLGIPVDHYCLGRGVTTAVDAGSAGANTFAGFRVFAAERSKTRLLAFLNISSAGLAFAGLGGDSEVAGELDLLKLIDLKGAMQCVERNRDLIVGVKVRLSKSVADGGRNEEIAYERALELAGTEKLPLMVHRSFSSVPLDQCLGRMRRGDIYTHMYHGFPGTIIDSQSRRVAVTVRMVQSRGVLFDVGHGQGSFNWTVAEQCAGEGFWPDTISSDLHAGTCEGPAYDLPTVMTRLLRVGMPLTEIIRCCTENAAKAFGWEDRIGTLGKGREADVTVLSVEPVECELEDCQGQLRRISSRIVPLAVWRAGEPSKLTQPQQWPNGLKAASQRKYWERLEIRDLRLDHLPHVRL